MKQKIDSDAEEHTSLRQGNVTITNRDPVISIRLHGHLTRNPDYTFVAEVYNFTTPGALDGGRISSLEVSRKGEVIMKYDYGWYQEPKSWKDKAVLKEIATSFSSHHDLSVDRAHRNGRRF